jgi:hypothetical protein
MSWTNHFQTKVVTEFAFHGTGAVIFRSRSSIALRAPVLVTMSNLWGG